MRQFVNYAGPGTYLGLSDHRARFYDTETQSFLSPDPLGPIDSPGLYQSFSLDPTSITDPTGRWGLDFHWYVIYYLASLALSDQKDIERIAWASQNVDEGRTRPYLPEPWSQRFHFPDPAGESTRPGFENVTATAVINAAVRSNNGLQLGLALHMFADSYAHQGYKVGLGHARDLGAPDDLKARARIASAAAVACYDFIHQYAVGIGSARPRYDTEALGNALQDAFMLLPNETGLRREVSLQTTFRAWGVDVPGYSPHGFDVVFRDELDEYRRLRSQQGDALSLPERERDAPLPRALAIPFNPWAGLLQDSGADNEWFGGKSDGRFGGVSRQRDDRALRHMLWLHFPSGR